MQVLSWVLLLALLAFALWLCYLCFLAVAAAGVVLFLLWPLVLGLMVGIALWVNGNDNLGMIIILGGVAGQIWLWWQLPETPRSDPMADKKRVYDIKGRIKGYIDRI